MVSNTIIKVYSKRTAIIGKGGHFKDGEVV